MKNTVVKCLVKNEENEILLIKRSDSDTIGGKWETPGGGVDEGETIEQAVIREVKEEAGVDVQVHYVGETKMLDDETGEAYCVHLFNGKLTRTELEGNMVDLSNNPDHQDFFWIPIFDIPTKIKAGLEIDSWTIKQLNF